MLGDTPTISALQSLLNNIGSIVASAIDWMGDYLELITTSGNELLLVFTVIPLVGLGIGLVRRMISLN